MIVVMERTATVEQIDRVIALLIRNGWDVHRSTGEEFVILGAIGQGEPLDTVEVELSGGVRQVVEITRPYRLADRRACPSGTRVLLGKVELGGAEAPVIPCLCEPLPGGGEEVLPFCLEETGSAILRVCSPQAASVCDALREKMNRMSPAISCFLLADVLDGQSWPRVPGSADGFLLHPSAWRTRRFLEQLAETGKPLVLRSSSNLPLDEILLAADGLLRAGHRHVALAIRSGKEKTAQPSLDIDFLIRWRQSTHLPIVVDLVGSGFTRQKIQWVARSAAALGVEGLSVELGREFNCRRLEPETFRDLSLRIQQISRASRTL